MVSQALGFVNRAIESKAPGARLGLVVFGADAATELPLASRSAPVRELSVDVPRGGTDIGRALEVAMGAFGSEGQRRVVLLSDGRENVGNARAASSAARALGVEILSIPLERRGTRDEVRVQGIIAPSVVRSGEPFEVQVAIESRSGGRAHLVLLRDGTVLRDEDLSLAPGTNRYVLHEEAPESGLREYEVIVNSDADRQPENNRHQTFVRVAGVPKVLYVRGGAGDALFLPEALRAQGLEVEELLASALPATLHEYIEYDLVILDNVSGFDMSLDKMEQLERFVRDAGGGLVKLGGDRSYSAGGYYDTPVERLLPVTMDVETEVRIPSLAVTFVIDKSGSMSSQAQGEEKLSLAKVAALSAIEVLNPLDRVAVLSFDAGYEWSVPATEAGNRQTIAETLRVLGAGGSTDLYRALEAAYRGTREQNAKLRHLIVLSDGLSRAESDYTALARRIHAEGITISTVAFGQDADLPLMANIATEGHGRFYHTEDPRHIPRIFTSETLVVSRDLLVEEPVAPVAGYPGEMLEGLDPDAFPAAGRIPAHLGQAGGPGSPPRPGRRSAARGVALRARQVSRLHFRSRRTLGTGLGRVGGVRTLRGPDGALDDAPPGAGDAPAHLRVGGAAGEHHGRRAGPGRALREPPRPAGDGARAERRIRNPDPAPGRAGALSRGVRGKPGRALLPEPAGTFPGGRDRPGDLRAGAALLLRVRPASASIRRPCARSRRRPAGGCSRCRTLRSKPSTRRPISRPGRDGGCGSRCSLRRCS